MSTKRPAIDNGVEPPLPGRRERKKAATRQALSDAAMKLFLERGFDDVTVREIAEAADVSTTTLMKHFPTKEALVFDRDDELEASLLAAVTDRPPATGVLVALRGYMRARAARVEADRKKPFPIRIGGTQRQARQEDFTALLRATPALSAYWQKMWMRHELALTRALETDLDRPEGDEWCRAFAHLVLEAGALAERSPDPARMLEVSFDLLERGVQLSSARKYRARSSR